MHHQPAQQDHPATGGHDWWRTALGNALQHYGLTPETLGHYCGQRPAGSLLSPDDNRELWSRACRDADDPLLGLRLHRLSLPAPILALQFACLTSASLGQAIDCLIEHAELFSPGLQIRHSTANRLTCQSDQPLPAPPARRHQRLPVQTAATTVTPAATGRSNYPRACPSGPAGSQSPAGRHSVATRCRLATDPGKT